MRSQKIIFFFRSGRKNRLGDEKNFPKDMLYGFPEVSEIYKSSILEQDDFPAGGKHSWIYKKWLEWKEKYTGIKWDHVIWYSQPQNLNRLNDADVIYTTSTTQGITLAILKYQKKLKPELVFLTTALGKYATQKFFWKSLQKIAPQIYWASLSRGEIEVLKEKLKVPLHFIPFGTDIDFWKPSHEINQDLKEKYFLAVGNDAHRDYPFLISCWKPEYPELRIVTSMQLPSPLPKNVKQIQNDWFFVPLDHNNHKKVENNAEALCRLYNESLGIIVPLKETSQPSGQSVTQQAMACRKPVLLTQITGLWESEYLVDGKTCYLYLPGDVVAFEERLKKMIDQSPESQQIAQNGYQLVHDRYTTRASAEAFLRVVKTIN